MVETSNPEPETVSAIFERSQKTQKSKLRVGLVIVLLLALAVLAAGAVVEEATVQTAVSQPARRASLLRSEQVPRADARPHAGAPTSTRSSHSVVKQSSPCDSW